MLICPPLTNGVVIVNFRLTNTEWGSIPYRHISMYSHGGELFITARIVTGMYDWNFNASNLVDGLGWMNINQRINYFTLLLTFKHAMYYVKVHS